MNPQAKGWRKIPMPAQIAIAVAVVLLLAVVGYVGLIKPAKQEVKKQSDQATALEQQLSALTSANKTAADQAKIMVADAFRLTKAMPESPDVGEIVLELNALAKKAGIRFDSIQPQAPVPQANYQVQPINVVFQGKFVDLSEFLLELKALVLVHDQKLLATGRLFTVDKLSFTQGEGGFPQISATLTIDAYVYGQEPTSTTSTTTGSTTTTETTTTSSSGSAAAWSGPTNQGAGS